MVNLMPGSDQVLPDSIPYYIHMAGINLPRFQEKSGLWAKSPYPYPYDITEGHNKKIDASMYDYTGWVSKKGKSMGQCLASRF
jgi:hypothetical protein